MNNNEKIIKTLNESRTKNVIKYERSINWKSGNVEFDASGSRYVFREIKRLLNSKGYHIEDSYYYNPSVFFKEKSGTSSFLDPNAMFILDNDGDISIYGYRFPDSLDSVYSDEFGVSINGPDELEKDIKMIVSKLSNWSVEVI